MKKIISKNLFLNAQKFLLFILVPYASLFCCKHNSNNNSFCDTNCLPDTREEIEDFKLKAEYANLQLRIELSSIDSTNERRALDVYRNNDRIQSELLELNKKLQEPRKFVTKEQKRLLEIKKLLADMINLQSYFNHLDAEFRGNLTYDALVEMYANNVEHIKSLIIKLSNSLEAPSQRINELTQHELLLENAMRIPPQTKRVCAKRLANALRHKRHHSI